MKKKDVMWLGALRSSILLNVKNKHQADIISNIDLHVQENN